jgi:hypothetical protein
VLRRGDHQVRYDQHRQLVSFIVLNPDDLQRPARRKRDADFRVSEFFLVDYRFVLTVLLFVP